MGKGNYSWLLLLIHVLFTILSAASLCLEFPITVLPALAQIENRGRADSDEGGFLYVGNARTDSISIIELTMNNSIENITVGSGTHNIKVSDDQQLVYTTDTDSSTISTVNTASNTLIDQINTDVSVLGVAEFNDILYVLYVGDVYGGKVLIIKNNTIKDEIKVVSGPEYIEMRPPDGRIRYVDNLRIPISVIDLVENRVIKNIDSGNTPHGLHFTKDGSRLFIVDMHSDTLSVIYSQTYVTNLGEDTVSKIDLRNLEIIKSKIPVGMGPHVIAFSADGDLAYISNMNGNDISFIDTFTDKVIATIPTGGIELHQIVAKKPDIQIIPYQNGSAVKTNKIPSVFIEIADDPHERERGLMFRKYLEPNNGMLFVYNESAYRSFTMKNTFIPLDMVFVDNDLRIIDVKKDVQPCQQDPCPSYTSAAPAKYVLEVNAGFTDQYNIEVGDRLEI
ncbi:MAG: DUF192 domain-containing protein [Thermoproteota archaeon]|nr:DUF192 domain-containing protein [Thermoproteota archaeon]